MKVAAAILILAFALSPRPACAQSLSEEIVQTGGYSTDGAGVTATQLRVFGEATRIRFNVEGAWAARAGEDTDAFGAAYPYEGRVQLIEAYGERVFRPRSALVAVRAGRFRTPFGIYSGADYAYSGHLRAPLIRYDDYYALSNNFLENGVSLVAGAPRLYVEVAVGRPGDVGEAQRRDGVDRTLRVQGSFRSLIVGVSHITTNPYQSPRFAFGRASFTGIDGRWMNGGVEVRGEWIAGQPFDGTRTTGGYVDLRVHRAELGPVTAVLRAERLDYDTVSPFALYATRYSGGARVRVLDSLSAQVNVIRQRGIPLQPATSLDVAFTYVYRLDTKRPE